MRFATNRAVATLRSMLNRYKEIGIDTVVAAGTYVLFGWVGVAVWAFFIVGWYATQLVANQKIIVNTLLSRLPNRCAFCHREIVDEGGVIDDEGIYHDACIEKLTSLEDLRKVAGISSSDAIHKPRRALK